MVRFFWPTLYNAGFAMISPNVMHNTNCHTRTKQSPPENQHEVEQRLKATVEGTLTQQEVFNPVGVCHRGKVHVWRTQCVDNQHELVNQAATCIKHTTLTAALQISNKSAQRAQTSANANAVWVQTPDPDSASGRLPNFCADFLV